MTELRRGKILRNDLHLWDGKNLQGTRPSSAGGVVVGLKIGNVVDVLSVFGSGTYRDNITLQRALNALGSANVTLLFAPGTWKISADVTVASNFACLVPGGAIFDVDATVTLTFSGPVIRHSDTWTSGNGTVTESGTRAFTGFIDLSGATLVGGTPLVFDGATADSFKTSLVVTDPTANRTLTMPDADVDLGDVVARTDAGLIQNLGLSSSVAASALTINVLTKALATASASSPVKIAFRNATVATGDYTERSITAALSITVPSGATLGFENSSSNFVYIYALDNSGTVELAVSNQPIHDEGDVHDTTLLDTGADNISPLYSETARTNVPIRLIGRATVAVTTAGTWASAATILVPVQPGLLHSSFRG